MNGEAVKISVDRARTLEVGNTRADMQYVENIEVTDELITTWSMSQPFAPLFRILGMRAGMLVSPKKIAESDDFLNREPVGAGAHRFVEEVDSDRLVFEANDDYWKPNAPLVNGVRWKMGLSEEQITNALIAGDTNVIRSPDTAALTTLEDAGFLVRSKPTNFTWRYWLNPNMEPWTNPHLRRAVNWAVDKRALVDVVWNGIGTPAHWGWLGPATGPDHDPNFAGYVKNPDKVREELALAGFPDGFEFNMNSFTGTQWIANDEFIQAQLAEFGIVVNLDTKPAPAYWREYFDLEASGHSSLHVDQCRRLVAAGLGTRPVGAARVRRAPRPQRPGPGRGLGGPPGGCRGLRPRRALHGDPEAEPGDGRGGLGRELVPLMGDLRAPGGGRVRDLPGRVCALGAGQRPDQRLALPRAIQDFSNSRRPGGGCSIPLAARTAPSAEPASKRTR